MEENIWQITKKIIDLDECKKMKNEDLSFDVIKKPTLLHKTKANDDFIRKLAHNITTKLVFKK